MDPTTTQIHQCESTDYYETPPHLFSLLNSFFNFQWDVCATSENAKVAGRFFSEAQDALTQDWYQKANVVFMNPPYSKKGRKDAFIKKALEESKRGVTTVAILPAKTDTAAHHDYIESAAQVQIINLRGRPRFFLNNVITGSSGRSPIMVVIFWGDGFLRNELEKPVRAAVLNYRSRSGKAADGKRMIGENNG